jgi:hypothetical protein
MLRKITWSDKPLLDQWIANDPEHRALFLPEFFYEVNRVSFVIEDNQGPVMFVKLDPHPPEMRLFIQFSNSPSRVAKAMLKHFSTVRDIVRKTGAKSMVFDTKNPKLASFCEKAFGFKCVGQSSDYRLLLLEDQNVQQ